MTGRADGIPPTVAQIVREGTFMITTITTITTLAANAAQAGLLAAIATVTLLGLLVQREILSSSSGERIVRLNHALPVAVLPLAVGFFTITLIRGLGSL